jgi:dsRNA-specific ribonuclease
MQNLKFQSQNNIENGGKNFLPMAIQLTDEKKRKTRLKKNVINWDGKLHDHDTKDYYNFIYTLLYNYGLMKEKDIEKVLDDEGMKIMRSAVTHWSLQEDLDYEVWETLGDTTLNKIMVWYMFRRFPTATSEELTEAKKLNVSKGQFPIYAHTIHLPQYVRYRNIQYLHGKNILTITLDRSIKEDTFEAFFGALEYLIDGKIMLGAGYAICYNIVSYILDQQQMTIQLSKIKDSITQLKEIFDNRKKLGDSFEYTFDYANRKEIVTLRFNKENPSPCVNHPKNPHVVKLEVKDVQGEKDGQRKASEQALLFLKKYCSIDWQTTTQK